MSRSFKLYQVLGPVVLLVFTSTSCAPLQAFFPTPTPTPTATVPSPTASSTATDTSTPTITLTPTDTLTPSLTLTPTETFTPTLTFTLTLTPSLTRAPSNTPTPVPPRIADMGGYVSCRYGPGAGYLFKYPLVEGNRADVVGRLQILSRQTDGSWASATWLKIQSFGVPPDELAKSKCWLNAKLVKVERGDINSVPDYFDLPKANEIYGASHLYPPPSGVDARRDGNVVTVFWNTVWMTEDDYRGYMIEAFVCYRGKYWFLPYGYVDSFRQNNNESTLAIAIPDEPGCSQPSHGQIFLAEKHGYTRGVIIPWPPFPAGSTSSQTPQP